MKTLVNFSILLAVIVIGLGAYTRLTDAGLGCPDWPGCYGLNYVPKTEQELNSAREAYPDRPVETDKAWNEMIHRYVAGTLGILILLVFAGAVYLKKHIKLSGLLFAAVLFQAALGMWTVTMNLLPIIVMGHLLGGFMILSLLVLLKLNLASDHLLSNSLSRKRLLIMLALVSVALPILLFQIALGGWTSSNYAAMACTAFPICNGDWQAQFNLQDVFSLTPPADNYEFGVLDGIARMNIHISHRIWAAVTFVYLLICGLVMLNYKQAKPVKQTASVLIVLLALQICLGIVNVAWQLPIGIAIAHNLVAAFLLTAVISLIWFTLQQLREAI